MAFPGSSRYVMIRPALRAKAPQTEYLTLSFCGFAFWWLVLLGIHLLACGYNVAYARFYWDFDSSFLSYTLEPYAIGMTRGNFQTIAYVHVFLATTHGACVVVILCGSCWKRTLVFSPRMANSGSSIGVARSMQNLARGNNSSSSALGCQVLKRMYMKVMDRHGLFGVNGKYFHTILVLRELLETALQTAQAVRMSKYLPRAQLNHFYVTLLVVNCWSSVIIYSRFFWRDEAYRRFALVVCDCALDLMSTVGVSVMIIMNYVDEYNVALAGFGLEVLDDDWIAQMLNEAQMILVTSWFDLAARVVFSFGLIIASTTMQELLRYVPQNRNQVHVLGKNTKTRRNLVRTVALRKLPLSDMANRANPRQSKGSARLPLRQSIHVGVAAWGLVVLALHIHASLQTPLVECMPKVKPMAGALPSCFLVNFNCDSIGISGNKQEVQMEWDKFDRKTAVKLHICHCPALEVPDNFDGFALLQDILVYNSTIKDWGESAAFTNAHHSKLATVSVVRTNMTDGLLPLGFQSAVFPTNLMEIKFCETNLRQLPDNIDTKWHVGSRIYLENSKFSSVPPVLARLQPYDLVLAGNPLTEIPPELFETDGMLRLALGRTKIRELPQHVVSPTTEPPFVDVRDTSVSFFWSWIDPLVEVMLDYSPMLLASGSTYCSDLDNIEKGITSAFSAGVQANYSPMLMNSSELNWEFLKRAVDCSPTLWITTFPIEFWDEIYSLKK